MDFTSNIIRQLGQPSIQSNQISDIGAVLGKGISNYGQQRQKAQAEQQAVQGKEADRIEALYTSKILKTQDPGERAAIMQKGYSDGIFDDEDMELFSSTSPEQLDSTLVDVLKADGYENLLPNQYRGDLKSPTTNKTIVYKNGTYQAIMNDGSRRVFDSEDNLLSGPNAKTGIVAGVKSGIQYEGDKAATVTGMQEQTKIDAKNRSEYIRQGRAAMDMMPKTQELIKLNELIESSGFEANKKAVADFFGVTNADQGLFNAKAGKLILDNIRALGANPTEGERAFLEKITPSIRQGKAVNRAILKDMYEVQKRQSERGRWLANNPSSTVDDYFFMEGVGDFSSNSNIDEAPQQKTGAKTTNTGGGTIKWGDLK